MMAET
jgi:hypothetical protein